jgi:type IV fimbrial biogenesis protein FimT
MKIKHNGFTFIEMITAILLIAVVANFTWPYLRHLYDEHEDDLMQISLLNTIQYAQRTALQTGAAVSICGSQTGDSCDEGWEHSQLVFFDQENRGDVVGKSRVLFTNEFPSHQGQLHWRSFPRYRTDLHFYGQGTLSDNGTFWYCHNADANPSWAIVINQAGKSRVLHPNQQGSIIQENGHALSCA